MSTINVNGISVHDYTTDDTAIRKKGVSDDPNYEVRGAKGEGNKGRINKHEDKQIEELAKHHDSGLYNDIQLKIMSGEQLTSKEMEELKEMALFFTPDFLNQAVIDGDISQQDADMLIMAGGLLVGGVSEDDLGKSLANFFSLNGEDRQFALDVMSDRSIEYDAKIKERDGKDKIKYTETHSAPNPEQGRLSIFLSNMQPGQQAHIQNYTNWNFDTSNNALAATLSDIDDFVNLSDTKKDALVNHLHSLGSGWAPISDHGHGAGPGRGPADAPVGGPSNGRPNAAPDNVYTPPQGEVMAPSVLADMGVGEQGRIDLGTLMFQVMADRIETLDNQVREYANTVDQQNKVIATNTNAMAALRGSMPDDGRDVNLSEVTFEDGAGNTVSLAGYLHNEGLVKSDADLGKVSQSDINSMMTTIGERNDVLNSESTATMTKLQQTMDKYQQAVQTQTNFEAKWNSMLNAIIGNLNR